MTTDARSRHGSTVGSAVRSLFERPRRGRVVLVLIVGVLTAGVSWYVGMDTGHAVTLGTVLAAVAVSWIAVPDHERVEWPEESGAGREGARRDVVQLSWSLRPHYGRIRQAALGRVQDLARYRLGLRQLDLDNPADRAAIERLIGPAAYATLRSRAAGRLPLLRSVVHCLDVLDRLDPSRSGVAHPVQKQHRQKENPR